MGFVWLAIGRSFLNAARRPAAHCADHLVVTVRKPKKLPPVKKHVLTLEKFRTVKRMLAAESPVSLKLIARTVGVSERTIRRAAKGEYDNYFKGAALRNAVDLRQVNSE